MTGCKVSLKRILGNKSSDLNPMQAALFEGSSFEIITGQQKERERGANFE